MSRLQIREIDHRLQTDARLLIQPFQTEMREHPVLPHHGHKVRCNADDQQVQQREKCLEINVVVH